MTSEELKNALAFSPFKYCFLVSSDGKTVVFAGDIREVCDQNGNDVVVSWQSGASQLGTMTVKPNDGETLDLRILRVVKAIADAKALTAGLLPNSPAPQAAPSSLTEESVHHLVTTWKQAD